MLGATVSKFLNQQGYEILEGNRFGVGVLPDSRALKVEAATPENLASVIRSEGIEYVVNCIGLIKQLIIESDTRSVLQAIQINSEFPRELEKLSLQHNFKIIQIATDCVYSGERGAYSEDDPHSPVDVYGMTKSLGEVVGPNIMTLRCSIIGPELNSNNSLFSWLISQPVNSNINGYINHYWNGLTSFHFAKIVSGIIRNNLFSAGKFHLLPSDYVTKKRLLELIAIYNKRHDIKITEFEASVAVNRVLNTIRPDTNQDLWRSAGYNEPPNVEYMVSELSEWALVN